MGKGMALLCVVCGVAAAADMPAPAGLDLIQARYAGTWDVAETTYATDFSRPGSKRYDACHPFHPNASLGMFTQSGASYDSASTRNR